MCAKHVFNKSVSPTLAITDYIRRFSLILSPALLGNIFSVCLAPSERGHKQSISVLVSSAFLYLLAYSFVTIRKASKLNCLFQKVPDKIVFRRSCKQFVLGKTGTVDEDSLKEGGNIDRFSPKDVQDCRPILKCVTLF